jgi:hypothetical protein
MKTPLTSLCAALLTSLLASGCGAAGKASESKLMSNRSFDICPWKFGESGLDIVRDTAAWQQLLSQAKPNAGDIRNWLPNFNDGQRVIIYRLGEKSSAGFSVSYDNPSVGSGNKLRLPITQTRPAPGTMQAMMLTSPCVAGLVQISSGTSLEVIDSANNAVLAVDRL